MAKPIYTWEHEKSWEAEKWWYRFAALVVGAVALLVVALTAGCDPPVGVPDRDAAAAADAGFQGPQMINKPTAGP